MLERMCVHNIDALSHTRGNSIAKSRCWSFVSFALTHWSQVTHIWGSKLTIAGSDNGFSPDRRQAVIWTNAKILVNGPLETNFR